MKMNLRKKMGNFVVVLMLMFMVLSIPIGVYADNDDKYLQGQTLSQGNTLTTQDIKISKTGHIAPYLSIREVKKAGVITYIFLQKQSNGVYKPVVHQDKKVASTATGVTLPSGKSVDAGTYQIRLCVNAGNTGGVANLVIDFLRCAY